MLCVDIITPCLQDVLTGEIIETEAIRIKRTSFLQNSIRRTVGTRPGLNLLRLMKYMHW